MMSDLNYPQVIRDEIAKQLDQLWSNKFDQHKNVMINVLIHSLPLRFKKSDTKSDALLISFHGAVDRSVREPPVFPPFFDASAIGNAHQLCVSDPSMLLEGSFSLSWYMGHHGFPVQQILPIVVSEIIRQLSIRRVVFFGGSGGGFAALFFSFIFPESIAVAACPQTDLFRHYPALRRRYREGCWPDLVDDSMLPEVTCTNVCNLYKKEGVKNTVIYLQSTGDGFHLLNHMAPFLNALATQKKPKIIVECSFWGKLGHSGSVPRSAFLPWLKSALDSMTIEPDDLLVMRGTLADAFARESVSSAVCANSSTPDFTDIRRAELLRDLELSLDR